MIDKGDKQNEALLKISDGSYTERSYKILSATPMGRFGEAEELIGALLFLVNCMGIPFDNDFSAY